MARAAAGDGSQCGDHLYIVDGGGAVEQGAAGAPVQRSEASEEPLDPELELHCVQFGRDEFGAHQARRAGDVFGVDGTGTAVGHHFWESEVDLVGGIVDGPADILLRGGVGLGDARVRAEPVFEEGVPVSIPLHGARLLCRGAHEVLGAAAREEALVLDPIKLPTAVHERLLVLWLLPGPAAVRA